MPAPLDDAVSIALPLVQAVEGCKLEAYPDPASGGAPWTIGWGETMYYDGGAVKEGDKISQSLADEMLEGRLTRIWHQLSRDILRWRDLKCCQQAALLSFAYNLGEHWYGADGFSRITLAVHSWQLEQIPWVLMLYRNPGSSVEVGLGRRRRAEGLVWNGVPSLNAVSQAQAEINSSADCSRLAKQLKQQPIPAPPKPTEAKEELRLDVPWYAQLDSATDQGRRMCFSSSCAMLLSFLKPGALKGPNGDDQYLGRVFTFGDTTDASAQIKALASYGIGAEFVRDADFAVLERQLEAGVPVPCGYLHRGPVSSPSGSGHWLIVVGITPTHVIVHDPLGEADLVTGATLRRHARFALYSRKNFGRRWSVAAGIGGSYQFAPNHGWAILAKPK